MKSRSTPPSTPFKLSNTIPKRAQNPSFKASHDPSSPLITTVETQQLHHGLDATPQLPALESHFLVRDLSLFHRFLEAFIRMRLLHSSEFTSVDVIASSHSPFLFANFFFAKWCYNGTHKSHACAPRVLDLTPGVHQHLIGGRHLVPRAWRTPHPQQG